eukprot:CAMPEP_0119402228 /NCGR_PEP_ID=MMETSP1334-20130426/142771_1 /TAXON_ID=127549 /ORGANISM="Calcidiscus leptoporus, Strain RCC1130" /LENGTH=34 /DNA_ID= /DNA_START= /DNA_END= /DNA_ORIENTATION=
MKKRQQAERTKVGGYCAMERVVPKGELLECLPCA